MFSHTLSAITAVHSHILALRKYYPASYVKRRALISLPDPRNECQQSVDNVRSCILENQMAVQLYESIINESAAFMCKNAIDDIATTS